MLNMKRLCATVALITALVPAKAQGGKNIPIALYKTELPSCSPPPKVQTWDKCFDVAVIDQWGDPRYFFIKEKYYQSKTCTFADIGEYDPATPDHTYAGCTHGVQQGTTDHEKEINQEYDL